MMECLLMKKHIRNFLYVYTQESWSEVIPLVFEIAVLNLQNSFGKSGFTKDELVTIITDLRNNEYYPKESKYQTIQKLSGIKGRKDEDTMQSNGQEEEHKSSQMTKSHRDKEEKLRRETVSKSIYPSWWANNENKDKRHHHHHHHSHKKHEHKKRHSKKTEEIPLKKNQANDDQQKTEQSKEHQQTDVEKRQQQQIVTTNESVNNTNKKKMLTLKAAQEKTRMNYKISYDKNLNPSSMENKTKAPMYCYSYNDNGGLQRNPSAENIHSTTSALQNNYHHAVAMERFNENIVNPHIVKGGNSDEGELSEFEVSDTTKHLFKTKIQQNNEMINSQTQSQSLGLGQTQSQNQQQQQYDQRQSSIQDTQHQPYKQQYTYEYDEQHQQYY